ncbi:hypothetical protein D3C85_1743600 [compost metagenome]
MRVRDLAHDGQPQARAASRGSGRPVEGLEDAIALFSRNPWPVVFHCQRRRVGPNDQRDAARLIAVAQRVVDQVAQQFRQQ